MIHIIIIGMTDNLGGVESYIMNLYRNIDRSKIQFDFIVNINCNMAYQKEISQLGGNIYQLHGRNQNLLKHHIDYNTFFKKYSNKYHILYYNTLSLANINALKLSKKYKIPKRIVHGHSNSDLGSSLFGIRTLLKKIHKINIQQFATQLFACSQLAGNNMFGNASFQIINNAINLDTFHYNHFLRTEMQKELNISTEMMIYGTIGRLSEEKNSLFIVDVFYQIKQLLPNSLFIHVGDGPLFSKMVYKIQTYGLENSYLLMGKQENVTKYYQVFDAFLLPSRSEGFSISLVEAQACDLTCFVSNSITKESFLLKNKCFQLPLHESPEYWAKYIIKHKDIILQKRLDVSKLISGAGFNIEQEAKKLEKDFLNE